jgi:hypothetical protein
MNFADYFQRDPGICGGETVLRGTRVTMRTVLASRAGASSVPVPVTDRGEVVAVLVGPDAVPFRKRAKRVLLPEYVKLILEGPLSDDVLEDLDAVRGER